MKVKQISTKVIPLGSTAFRQWRAKSHCRLLHGYRLTAKIYFYAENLDETNWIFDFGNCKEIKTILENQFDHTTCVAADDPELDMFKLMDDKDMIDLRIMENGVSIEKNSEWIFNTVNDYVKNKTNNRVSVIKVEVWEHEGNSAIYEVN
jgi:6-pyruvoyltetrahydropterin/6-carboxytetrahydropterin synthase|tara:strand:+ start:29 stop:475 length:447 start_codon:yes stop_codon:yes gene_type:complete